MTTETDLHEGLRRVAERLDAASAPVDAAAVMARRPPGPPRPVRALLAAAAVLALLVGVVAVLATGDEDEGVRADLPSTSESATTERPTVPPRPGPPTSPPATPVGVPVPVSSFDGALGWDALPAHGLAVVEGGRVTLLDDDGIDLGSFAEADVPGLGNDPSAPLLLGPGPTVAIGASGTTEADGCVSNARRGVRVAICGAEQEELVRLAPNGEATPLAGLPFGATLGRWRAASPSPDGRWVLGTFSTECEVPFAVLVPAEGGPAHTADGLVDQGGDELGEAVTSVAIGWTDRGDAIVHFRDTACGTADPAPGAYLVDPDTGARTLLRGGVVDRVLRWEHLGSESDLERAFGQATSELGLNTCCDADDRGGDLTRTVDWQGRVIPVHAAGLDGAPSAPLTAAVEAEVAGVVVGLGQREGSDALAFTCGEALWILGADGTWVATKPMLRDLAAALIPRLGCTAGPPPGLEGG